MFNISTTGEARCEWCQYQKLVPLGNGDAVTRVWVACPTLAIRADAESRRAYEAGLHLLSRPDDCLSQKEPFARKLARLAMDVRRDGSRTRTPVQLAAGVFAGPRGLVVSTCHISALRVFPPPVSELPREEIREECNGQIVRVGVLDLQGGDRLNAVIVSAEDAGGSLDRLKRIAGATDSPQNLVTRLSQWTSHAAPYRPAVIIAFGRGRGDGDRLSTCNGSHQGEDALLAQKIDRLVEVWEALRERLLSLPDELPNANLALFESLRQTLAGWPAEQLVQRLLHQLDDLEQDRDFERARPLWACLMRLYDMVEDAQASRPGDDGGWLKAFEQELLSGLASVGIEPFREAGTAFNPVTQECIRTQSAADGRSFVTSPRCGFRREARILRREKIIVHGPQEPPSERRQVS